MTNDSDKKILIVEDDDLLRRLLQQQLAPLYLVLEAKDGEEALSQIQENRPDLIVLDLMLPKINGFEILKKLRSYSDPALAKTPVIVVSNLVDKESINQAEAFHIEAYFTKADATMGIIVNRVKRIFASI